MTPGVDSSRVKVIKNMPEAAKLPQAEILFGLLILMRPVSPRISAWGSLAASGMFLITLTLLLSTPGVIARGYSFPVLSAEVGQFLIKDVILLGAAPWTAGEAWRIGEPVRSAAGGNPSS